MGKILVVEDEIIIRTGLVEMVKSIDSSMVVYETGAAKEALNIAMEEDIDAFLLDIQLEDYSGYELAKQIRELESYKLTPIIFITAILSRELEAFRNIHCYDYIIKPFSEIEVERVFRDIIAFGITKHIKSSVIKIKEKGFTYILNQEDLIYIEARNRKLFIATIHEESDITQYSLAKFSEQLSERFIQCHKSFVVNINFVRKIDRSNNVLFMHKKETAIPIGRKYKENVWGLIK